MNEKRNHGDRLKAKVLFDVAFLFKFKSRTFKLSLILKLIKVCVINFMNLVKAYPFKGSVGKEVPPLGLSNPDHSFLSACHLPNPSPVLDKNNWTCQDSAYDPNTTCPGLLGLSVSQNR